MKKTALAAVVLVLCTGYCLPVRAEEAVGAGQEAKAAWDDSWRRDFAKYESVHFTIYAHFEDAEYIRRFQGDLERRFSLLQKEFWDFIPPKHREEHIEVVVFRDPAAFDDFGERDAGVPHGKQGYLNIGDKRLLVLRQDRYYKDVMIGVHELTHVFNAFCTPYTPVWLDEGMAQFYANYAGEETGNPDIKDGINPAALEVIDAALKRGRFARITALLQMGEEVFYGRGSQENYAEAWALVFYMRRGSGAGGDRRFTDYYAVISRGGDDYAAFTQLYAANLQVFETMWLSYLERLYREKVVRPVGEGRGEKAESAGVGGLRETGP